jgi:hypothetical protein
LAGMSCGNLYTCCPGLTCVVIAGSLTRATCK